MPAYSWLRIEREAHMKDTGCESGTMPKYIVTPRRCSGGRPSSVDGDDRTVDKLSLLRAEISHERGDVLRRSKPSDWLTCYEFRANLLFLMRVVLVEVAFHEGCLHGSW